MNNSSQNTVRAKAWKEMATLLSIQWFQPRQSKFNQVSRHEKDSTALPHQLFLENLSGILEGN